MKYLSVQNEGKLVVTAQGIADALPMRPQVQRAFGGIRVMDGKEVLFHLNPVDAQQFDAVKDATKENPFFWTLAMQYQVNRKQITLHYNITQAENSTLRVEMCEVEKAA